MPILEFLILIFAIPMVVVVLAIGGMIIEFIHNLLIPGEKIKETMLYWTYEIYKERWKWRMEDRKKGRE